MYDNEIIVKITETKDDDNDGNDELEGNWNYREKKITDQEIDEQEIERRNIY